MPAAASHPLSAEQIDALRADLASGQTPMVWFTAVAVGMDAGRSAKVVALGEPADGDFIQVRPTGSKDVLSFSATELTLDKPARHRKPQPPAEPEPAPEPAPAPKPVEELLVVRERPTRRPGRSVFAEENPISEQTEPQQAAKPGRPAKGASKTKAPAPVTVTLSSTPDGEWTVDVQTGTKRAVRAQPVSAGSVAAAARALGGDIESAIDGVLAAARDQQRARVAALEAELAAARQALADLAE